ncbi:uncharacterized protein MELLADRAFT_103659 [Melampsora larici-populina 98AG31]|uniref:Uncharacterized protein n=1 Tax=Melampsora larici-populina (strain 98AG31 / pathotype 3-4-7) TaxID=747676 RepID=F4RC21_MELLP|nr:uncharacterized protein MELLADRAFT_103659 [Melampsora larici-populina 98AG31]EGG10240.1 hypothetical protein MELLADRAFT_103659 [Melampsora larici-populina 98AG31]
MYWHPFAPPLIWTRADRLTTHDRDRSLPVQEGVDWKTKVMTCHSKKKSRSNDGEKSDSSHSGLPYADEWLLDYDDWSIYYDVFVSAVSKSPVITKRAIAHKTDVERVFGEMGWLTALKYDMRIREFALVEGGEQDGWDPSTRKLPAKKAFEKGFQQKEKPYQKWGKCGDDNPVVSGSGSLYQKEKFKFKNGYTGNNFDPKFAEKKAAAAEAAKNNSSNK